MKFLHTSDLHIGKTVCGFSMLEDQAFIFDQILAYVRSLKPDALVIAGDVYDKQVPASEAVVLLDRFITAAAESVTVMVVAGNHDSPERLAFANAILARSGVYIASAPTTVELHDGYGPVRFYLMPFMKPSHGRLLFPDREFENSQSAVAAVVDSFGVDDTTRNVLAAHQYFVSHGQTTELSGAETGFIGGVDAVDVKIIKSFDYAALGHIHTPQRVGADHIRYAGSPVKYAFSESNRIKTVTYVELLEKGRLFVTDLPLTPLRDMRQIRGPIEALLDPETANSADPEDYLHVTLTDENEVLDAMNRLQAVYPNVMRLSCDNARTRTVSDVFEDIGEELSKPPEALFAEFFLAQNGAAMTAEQEAAVTALLRENS